MTCASNMGEKVESDGQMVDFKMIILSVFQKELNFISLSVGSSPIVLECIDQCCSVVKGVRFPQTEGKSECRGLCTLINLNAARSVLCFWSGSKYRVTWWELRCKHEGRQRWCGRGRRCAGDG